MAKYNMTPREVDPVDTPFRRIQTKIPVPESLPTFEVLQQTEPKSMMGMPPVVWDRAEGIQVYDRWGNMWLDWSSCVLVANSGHGRPEVRKAIQEVLERPLLATYVFVHEGRAQLTRMLSDLAPDKATYHTFILSTGSEATENAIKLARTYGIRKGGERKHVIVSFGNAFHGRTLGAQLAGGMDKQKGWIVKSGVQESGFLNVPFPDGFKNENIEFQAFLDALGEAGLTGADVAGVITESYQGVGPDFLPAEYAQQLEAWCKEHDAVLIMDEVQAGFGRTGKMFCFEHYGVAPDLICCGKGVTSSLPLSAVIGREDILGLYAPGSMTSTHSGSPLPVAAAIANLKILLEEDLAGNAARLDPVLRNGLETIQARHPQQCGCVQSRGLVAGIQIVKPGSKEPDADTALRINERCFEQGLLMFAPVGVGGECIKIAPPLTISEEALQEGLDVLASVCDEVLAPVETSRA